MNWRPLIPNSLTSTNLIMGVCSMMFSMKGDIFWGAVCILLALVADGLDGRTARALGVSGEMGKELDSLCDLVSFGVAPGILAHQFVLVDYGYVGWFVPLLFAVCGCFRLARFNVMAAEVHGYFMGVAIPAGSCFIATSTLLLLGMGFDPHELGYVYPIVMSVIGLLMVSTIHYPDFKGAGEKIYLPAKVFAAVMFASIVYIGREAIVPAVLFAIFATYDVFGIVNTICGSVSGDK